MKKNAKRKLKLFQLFAFLCIHTLFCFFKAVMQKKPEELLTKLNAIPGSQPIGSRILSTWHYWQDGLNFMQTTKDDMDMRTKKKVSVSFLLSIIFSSLHCSYLHSDL